VTQIAVGFVVLGECLIHGFIVDWAPKAATDTASWSAKKVVQKTFLISPFFGSECRWPSVE
jgi:hypothetical protein